MQNTWTVTLVIPCLTLKCQIKIAADHSLISGSYMFPRNYSRTSMARTLMAHLPRLFRTRSWVPRKWLVSISRMLKIYVKVFYVMGKALSGELSCPCDRSCFLLSMAFVLGIVKLPYVMLYCLLTALVLLKYYNIYNDNGKSEFYPVLIDIKLESLCLIFVMLSGSQI